jgi:hypothetical protein
MSDSLSNLSPQSPGSSSPYGTSPSQPGEPLKAEPLSAQTSLPKKKTAWWLGVLIVVMVLVAGGAYYFFQVRSTPEKTLDAYCDALMTGNAQERYNQLSSSGQKETSIDVLKKLIMRPAPSGCKVFNVQVNGSKATAIFLIIEPGYENIPVNFPYKVNLVMENGIWKVDSMDLS